MTAAKKEDEWVLAEAACLLANCQDYSGTIQKIAQLAVSSLAMWCIVDVVKSEGGVERIAVAHSDSEKAELAEIIKTRYPASATAQRGVYKVIETRQSILIPQSDEAMWSRRADDPEHLRIILELGSSSYMCVPLLARGRVVGTIIFMSSSRTYDEVDLRLAEQLALRFALAVDNALMFQRMQAAIQAREDFISIAAHELRTPLTSLILRDALLQRLLSEPDNGQSNRPTIDKALAISVVEVKRLSELINALLDSTKIDSGGLELKLGPVNLTALARDLCERFAAEAAKASCVLNCRGEFEIVGQWDQLRLEQVVANLLSNAIKYGTGNPIDVQVYRLDDRAFIKVKDQGEGIAKEEQPRLFSRFERLSRHKGTQGLGLGLYIARAIVEKHGGTIQVESVPGTGATFLVALPWDIQANASFSV